MRWTAQSMQGLACKGGASPAFEPVCGYGQAGWESDSGEGGATVEYLVTDPSHAIGKSDGGERRAREVF